MEKTVVLCALNAKYVHVSPAPWCLAAGVKAFAPELYGRIRIIDAHINQPPSEVLEQIMSKEPAVAGFSCYIWNIDATLALCRALKRALPEVIIVLGGPEVSYRAGEVLQNNPEVDYILTGEGEESFPRFLRALFAGGRAGRIPDETPRNLPGLCARLPGGDVYESAPCVLEGVPPSPLSAGYAEAARGRIAYFETSRGCPYSCAFCLSGEGARPRFFELDELFGDLLRLAGSGVKTIKFVDRTFNANAAHANRILRFILDHYGKDIPAGVCFHFEIAGDILREETFALLEQMPPGAVQLEIGIQSFCEKALEAVNRKTNTALLESNIRRLVEMGNMHIHIDLIAGLPHETLEIFAESFNRAYSLGAHMLQLGFLKLLYGSAMRARPRDYPCEYSPQAPYEVRSTPWISCGELRLLHYTESALERVYNSGRFRLTAEYVLKASGKSPFEFYTGLGAAAHMAGLDSGVSLDDYTAFLQEYCAALPGVDREKLRDHLVRDRLATNSTGGLPPCLRRDDELLAKAVKRLSQNPGTAPKKSVRRGAALLYGAKAICWADYDPAERNPVTGRWKLNEIPFEKLLK